MKALAALFGKSPFGPLQSHMQVVQSCVERLAPLLTATLEQDIAAQSKLVEEIAGLETDADQIKNDLRSHLPKSMFLPVARGDLLELLAIQDRIADRCQSIGLAVSLRPLAVHDELRAAMKTLAADVVGKCERAGQVIDQLDELLETGFSGAEAEKVLALIDGLDADEVVAEGSGIAASRTIVRLESELGAVDTVLWLDVSRQLAELANLAEALGNRLRLLLAK